MTAVGVGFRSGCGADEMVALLLSVLDGERADVLAAPASKAGAAALVAAAEALTLPLVLLDEAALSSVADRCRTVMRDGRASVAETCALAAAGRGSRLLAPRAASVGATCAVARA